MMAQERKEFNFHMIGLGHQDAWPPFCCLMTPIGSLSKSRQRRERERDQTKGLLNEQNNSCVRAL